MTESIEDANDKLSDLKSGEGLLDPFGNFDADDGEKVKGVLRASEQGEG